MPTIQLLLLPYKTFCHFRVDLLVADSVTVLGESAAKGQSFGVVWDRITIV